MFKQRFTLEQYTRMLMGLLPVGAAWPREQGTDLYNLFEGVAVEFTRLDASLMDLVNNAFPGSAETMLPEWEEQVGLPNCFPIPATVEERQALVKRICTWPGAIPTGWSDTGAASKGSAIVSGIDTTELFVGDYLSVSDGIGDGYYKVISKTASTATLEQPFKKSVASVNVAGYICEPQCSQRFFELLALFLGYEIASVEINEPFVMGPLEAGTNWSGDTTEGSPLIAVLGGFEGDVDVGQYVSVSGGFPLKEQRIVSKGTGQITLNQNAIASVSGVTIVPFVSHGNGISKPFGMGDGIGDALQTTITINFTSSTYTDGNLLECVFNKLRQAHIYFVFNFS